MTIIHDPDTGKNREDDAMEKLMVEITGELEDIANFSLTDEFVPSRKEYLREVARIFIARILKAAVGGMRLPGEVGRDVMADFVTDGFDEGVAMEGTLRYELKPGDTIIALRPEGQEEEG